LLDELENASFTLYGCKNYFGNLTNSNIKRKETTELLNWVKSPLPTNSEEKNKNILFLSGSAGCGKTTILRDFL
jgi:Rad17 cell cycle checkpoint protein.